MSGIVQKRGLTPLVPSTLSEPLRLALVNSPVLEA